MRTIMIALLALVGAAPLLAQGTYPSRPVQLVVSFAPGGPVDVVARVAAQHLPEAWGGQPAVVLNRPGASGIIAVRQVTGAPPDGHTVLIHSDTIITTPLLNANAGYDIGRDLLPVVNIADTGGVLIARSDLPAASLQEVVALAKTRPMNYGTVGAGSIPHLMAAYILNVLCGTNMQHISYGGAGPTMAAVLSGQAELGLVAVTPTIPHIKQGALKALAVTGATRAAWLPDVPTFLELGFPDSAWDTWVGAFMPAGTPEEVAERFRTALDRSLAMPAATERLASLGFRPVGGTAEAFRATIVKDRVRWQKIIDATGIRLN